MKPISDFKSKDLFFPSLRIKFFPAQLKEGIKGKSVRKEVRNVRHFEEGAGVDLLLNEEPDFVIVIVLDPYRRAIASDRTTNSRSDSG